MRIWLKTLKLILSPIGVSLAFVMVGVWASDLRWALTGVVLLGFVTWAIVLMDNTRNIKVEVEWEEDDGDE